MNGMTVALKVLFSRTDSRIFGTDGRSFFFENAAHFILPFADE
jgi:hypothetical protein